MRVRLALVLALAASACGDDLRPVLGNPNHPSMDSVWDAGGAHLATVDTVTITFPNDRLADVGVAFDDFVGGSRWLAVVGDEYGVRGGAHLAHYVMPADAPAAMTTEDVTATLERLRADGSVPSTRADGSPILYMIYLPSTTIVTSPYGAASCTSFAGYHDAVKTEQVPFAVIADCGGGRDARSEIASHELIEAATNPFQSGIVVRDGAPDVTEVADLCEFMSRGVEEGGFELTRSWSQLAAEGERADPCVPFQAGDRWTGIDADLGKLDVDAGQTVRVVLTGWSSAPGSDFPVIVADTYGFNGRPVASLSADRINDGGQVTAIIEVPADDYPGVTESVTFATDMSFAQIKMKLRAPAP